MAPFVVSSRMFLMMSLRFANRYWVMLASCSMMMDCTINVWMLNRVYESTAASAAFGCRILSVRNLLSNLWNVIRTRSIL